MNHPRTICQGEMAINHEGSVAWRLSPEMELYATVVTTMGTEDKYYENSKERVSRIASLVRQVSPMFVAQLAIYARETMHLRSVPLLLLVELAGCHHGDSLVSKAVSRTIQRADEIAELLMCYQWRNGKKSLAGLSTQLRKGLAVAFNRFDEYQLAKYDRKDRRVTLRDALILVHPTPQDEVHEVLFHKILHGTLETPYSWETELSTAGQKHQGDDEKMVDSKREVWTRLVRSRRLGYMATLRNLRNLLKLGVDEETLEMACKYIKNPEAVRRSRQLPFRYLSAYLCFHSTERWFSSSPFWLRYHEIQRKVAMLQEQVEKHRQGCFKATTRKVKRFPAEKDGSIFHISFIEGDLEYSPKMLHRRIRTRKLKCYSALSKRNQHLLLTEERRLVHLSKQANRLKRVVERSDEEKALRQFGTNGIKVMEALEAAVDCSAENIPGFDENTSVLLACDVSGSMMQTISSKSSVQCYHIGLLLAMLLGKKCKNIVTGIFGSTWHTYDMPSEKVLHNTVDMMSLEGTVGYATNGHKVIDWLINNRRVMDKVMLFTDCQLWNNTGDGANLKMSWTIYKEIAPQAKLYLFDLAGYGDTPVSMQHNDVFIIAGWSDKVFDILVAIEHGKDAIDEIHQIKI